MRKGMTDKVQKIREEIERLKKNWQLGRSSEAKYRVEMLEEISYLIDSMKEEPVSKKFAFKAIPRLLEMIEPTDRAKAYIAKLADTLEVEGYSTDAKIVRVSLKIMNGEKVPMATMDEEPVSEELEEAAKKAATQTVGGAEKFFWNDYYKFKAGAEWQKKQDQSTIELAEDHAMLAGMNKMEQQMMENVIDATIGLPYENKDGGYTHLIDVSRPLPVGNNKIAIIFKED